MSLCGFQPPERSLSPLPVGQLKFSRKNGSCTCPELFPAEVLAACITRAVSRDRGRLATCAGPGVSQLCESGLDRCRKIKEKVLEVFHEL